MARTLVQIQKQIAKLEKEAATVRTKEVAGVIERIKVAIDFYGLTTADLFEGHRPKGAAKVKGAATSTKAVKPKKAPAPAKYVDKASGKTWNGHGKRPGWFVKAIDDGAKPEDLAF